MIALVLSQLHFAIIIVSGQMSCPTVFGPQYDNELRGRFQAGGHLI